MKKVHFIAIAGSAMHNLAIALHLKGIEVTGSDDTFFEPSKSRLKKYNLLPDYSGWNPAALNKNIDAVILGMHAHADNPELQKAKELGLKVYSYPEFIFHQSKNKTRVVIGGSHGKTTITSMVLHALSHVNKEVDYMVGAQLDGFEVMVKLTEDNDFIVLEGDEYLSSPLDKRPKFHLYQANIALISGIAWDHVNVFPTFENYLSQFSAFIDTISDGGVIIYNEEDEHTKKLVENHPKALKKVAYSLPNHYIKDGITYIQTNLGPIPLKTFGKHNLSNLEGAKMICRQLGILDEDFYEAIASFSGASKRLEVLVDTKEKKVFKDFAHAPSKVKSTTEAVVSQFPYYKIYAMFELHTYSSLNADFLYQYKDSLAGVEKAIIYYSDETIAKKRLKPLSTKEVEMQFGGYNLMAINNKELLKQEITKIADEENAVFLLMSSGNWDGVDVVGLLSK